jgi:hypothetical protein
VTPRPPERDDLDALLNSLLPFAQDMLRKHGEFLPFGAVMTTDGAIGLVAGDAGEEHPPSQEVIDLLADGMRARAEAGEITAAGICFDVRLRTPDGKATDAIQVSLEHRAGDAASVLMPYSKGRFTGLKFGELSSAPGERRVFAST